MRHENKLEEISDEFIKSLLGEDELGVVIRAHFHVEAKLLELLHLLGKDENHLSRLNLEFSQHVELAVALGLNAEHTQGLRALGKLRNDFAHKLDSELSENRITSLYEALSATDKKIVQDAYQQTMNEFDSPSRDFKKLSPKERFVLIATTLHGILVAYISMVRARKRRRCGKG